MSLKPSDGLARRAALSIVPGMKLTPISLLRRAAPGEPTARAIAKKIGTTPGILSLFESGRYELPPPILKRYAKAIGQPEVEVRRRFAMTQLSHYRMMVRTINATLKKLGVRPRRLGKRLDLTG